MSSISHEFMPDEEMEDDEQQSAHITQDDNEMMETNTKQDGEQEEEHVVSPGEEAPKIKSVGLLQPGSD
eukprot:CAMPEP_0197049004 /NCGR_PEP_ID=MMETSP1384-20130603/24250_1 /TAXON_ID=29189 /ORGANISM="Ammonia sp." /LENGTH=68 /DNA_ID=CAMNT_0042481223 /DNA_START=166 /DNA_END=369 /DNA_ORIENTATION=+